MLLHGPDAAGMSSAAIRALPMVVYAPQRNRRHRQRRHLVTLGEGGEQLQERLLLAAGEGEGEAAGGAEDLEAVATGHSHSETSQGRRERRQQRRLEREARRQRDWEAAAGAGEEGSAAGDGITGAAPQRAVILGPIGSAPGGGGESESVQERAGRLSDAGDAGDQQGGDDDEDDLASVTSDDNSSSSECASCSGAGVPASPGEATGVASSGDAARRHRHHHGPPGSRGGATRRTCVICLERYRAGEKISVLPCAHRFHAKCVGSWLAVRRFCPVCKRDASEPPPPPIESDASLQALAVAAGQGGVGGEAGGGHMAGWRNWLLGLGARLRRAAAAAEAAAGVAPAPAPATAVPGVAGTAPAPVGGRFDGGPRDVETGVGGGAQGGVAPGSQEAQQQPAQAAPQVGRGRSAVSLVSSSSSSGADLGRGGEQGAGGAVSVGPGLV